jgi:LacI family transcriptional regulator
LIKHFGHHRISESFLLPDYVSRTRTITIADVARDAGCSINTVSRALNNLPGVSASSKARIESSAHRLGYVPSRVARSLLTRKTNTIGLVVTDCTNPFYARLIRAIEDDAFARGFNVTLCNSGEDHEREVRAIKLLIESRVDGMLITPVQFASDHIADVIRRSIPTVLVGRRFLNLDTCWVMSDNEAGARAATSLLLSLGHRRIGHVTGRPEISSARQRFDGYQAALEDHGVAMDEALIVRGERNVEGGRECAHRLLSIPSPPSAVFAYNDLQALGVMRAARERGLTVPHDLAVVGCDNIELSAYFEVPLTTVAQPTYAIGRSASSLLFRMLAGEDVSPTDRTVLLEPELIVRESSGGLRLDAGGRPE